MNETRHLWLLPRQTKDGIDPRFCSISNQRFPLRTEGSIVKLLQLKKTELRLTDYCRVSVRQLCSDLHDQCALLGYTSALRP